MKISLYDFFIIHEVNFLAADFIRFCLNFKDLNSKEIKKFLKQHFKMVIDNFDILVFATEKVSLVDNIEMLADQNDLEEYLKNSLFFYFKAIEDNEIELMKMSKAQLSTAISL